MFISMHVITSTIHIRLSESLCSESSPNCSVDCYSSGFLFLLVEGPLPGPRLLRLVPPPCAGRFSPSTPDWFPSAAPKPAASTTAHEETPGSRASFASTPGSAAPAYSSCASAFDAPPAARRHPGSVHHIRPAAGPPWEPFSPTPRCPLRAPLWPPRALPTRSPPSSAAALADAAAGRTAPARCARSAPGSAATPRPENASQWPSPCRHDRRSPDR